MSDKSKIEWTDASWNPVVGCTKIAAGCKNCYAERMAHRLAHIEEKTGRKSKYGEVIAGYPQDGQWLGNVFCDEKSLGIPLHWKKPRRIFVCSMSDLFHEKVPFTFINKVLKIISRCPQHIFQILTKRPTQAKEFLNHHHTLENLWLGTSISTQEDADKNIPILLQIPAAVRFVSFEPLLEEIDIRNILYMPALIAPPKNYATSGGISEIKPALDWAIVGGESGPGARPMHPDWPRSIRDQCVAAGVPFFFKQWGRFKPSQKGTIAVKDDGSYQRDPTGKFEWKRGYAFEKMLPLGKKKAGRLLDGKEWNEYPKVRGEV